MNYVKRVSQSLSGVPDGVELETDGVITAFLRRKMMQRKTTCSLKASWTSGLCSISFSEGSHRKMISVRIDELCALLHEAADARSELDKEAPAGDAAEKTVKESDADAGRESD